MNNDFATRVVTPQTMIAIDRSAAASGLSSFGFMRAAGHAVAAAALRFFPGALRFAVLCGPGNNGGDGWVAACVLAEAGATVAVYALGSPANLKGDAALAFAGWQAGSLPLSAYEPATGDVVIDAVFGAGLARHVPEDVLHVMRAVTAAGLCVLAVDLPSGVDGRSGAVMGESFTASHTVTFMARKPGHLLLPGRTLSGTLEVVDIGIPDRIMRLHADTIFDNAADLWQRSVRALDPSSHKYRRGHLVVFSGTATSNGAARMSAAAGLSSGAGLVTMAAPADALPSLAAHLTAVMLKQIDDLPALQRLLHDERLNAFVLGPGFGDPGKARDFATAIAGRGRCLVLDADGITAFKDYPKQLFEAFAGPVRLVLTPHDGEFARLFPDLAGNDRLSKVDRAVEAARRANAVVVLKGADTVIADPDGRAAINGNAPPWLATAGSGDVLAGIVGAHMAQGMPAFEAAASAVWRHGAAGHLTGEGMTAEDLIQSIRPLPQRP